MSEPYEIFSLIVAGLERGRAIDETHRILGAHGGVLDSDCTIYLSDVDHREFEPEDIVDPAQALVKLAAHPTLGTISYRMPEGNIAVEYKGLAGRVHFVAIAIRSGAFDAGGAETRRRYESIARELHARLSATRTIFDYCIERCLGVRWDEELARLREQQFEGKFAFLDLRRAR